MSFTTKYNQEYISVVEKPDEKYHRYKVILHEADLCFHFATFDNTEQLDFFAQTVGFEYVPTGFEISERFGLRNEYQVNRRFKSIYFWYKEELPANAKPIKALSNGSIVTCYFTNDGKTITFYRPNPNSTAVYHPLTLEQHINHVKVYGCY